MKMMMIVLVLISLLFVPIWSNVDEGLESSLAVAQCRAACLDQFSDWTRNEDNCVGNSDDCYLCWEMCRMVIERFEIWAPVCIVRDACPPGCKYACDFITAEEDESISNSSALRVRYVYEPNTDRVSVEWMPDRDLENGSIVLYSVFMKDDSQEWNQVGQTTSHVAHIRRGLLSRHTEIRVIGVNATHHVSDSKASYLGSHITDSISESIIKITRNFWKPHLESLTKNGVGLQATIVWPMRQDENGSMLYEVAWSVIDDTIEITGHLHTTNNAAILTLWPDSLYSVQVNCYGADKTIQSQSDILVIDTKSAHVNKEKINIPSCAQDERIALNSFAVLSAFFISFIIVAIFWVLKVKRRQSTGNDECNRKLKNNPEIFQIKPTRVQQVKNPLEDKFPGIHRI